MALEMFVYKRYASVAKYSGNSKYIVIPQNYKGVPVTEIRAGVFEGTSVECVVTPKTLQIIGANAFANCPHLRFIGCNINDALIESLSHCDDTDCNEWPDTSILPSSLITVESGAFKGTAIKRIAFSSTSMELGDSVFEKCRFLQTAEFNVCRRLSLGRSVFMDSSIRCFCAPGTRIDTLPEFSFANCTELISVDINFSAVGKRCFYQCQNLEKLNTPKHLKGTGAEAFTGCQKLSKTGSKTSNTKHSFVARKECTKEQESALLLDAELHKQRQTLLHMLCMIKSNAKAVTKMSHTDWDTYDTGPGMGNPLFVMNINYSSVLCKKIPSTIKGAWEWDCGTHQFRIQIPSALADVKMTTLRNNKQRNFRELLNHLTNKKVTVILDGKQQGNIYIVYDMTPVHSREASQNISTAFFRKMVECIRNPIPKDVDLGAMLPPFTLGNDEYDTFIEICGSRLPAWVLNAYRKNVQITRSDGFLTNVEDRRHARRALELLLNIDWLPCAVNIPTVSQARHIMDESFFGLEEVKIRMEEVIAQIRRTGTLPKWGILLHGPAGTGKTSIAKAIAKMLDIGLIQMDLSSLGDDPDEISGTSRIYNNAKAGMLLESMYNIRSSKAVLLANEIDKATEGRGGRSAADILLTILDKTGFYENFLEEVIPTDSLFCIGTCNDLSKISRPLRDRFLVIDIPPYTPMEKKVIFRDYVLPKTKERTRITTDQMHIDENAIDLLVSEYALEPGARDLEQYAERLAGDYCRYADGNMTCAKRTYTVEDIKALFGPGRAIVRSFAINPGEVNAAFYHEGKAHFFLVEASITPGSGKFEVLGPVGKTQAEYCKVAYWCVRNTTNSSACDLSKYDVTVFVPQPIPDGSGNYMGLACYAAICSRILNRNLAIQDTCFIGGCDLNGSLYFDENNLTPLLQAMKNRGMSTLYAPMGTNCLIDAKVNSDCKITVIEGPDATTLFCLAAIRNNFRC